MVNAPADPAFRTLDVAIVGGGVSGVAAAIALRRQGHRCTVYERYDYVGQVGASISCAKNGGQWLRAWDVPIEDMKPVDLLHLTMHDYSTGNPDNVYDISDYREKWGENYWMFHREDMHATMREAAFGTKGPGPPAKLLVNRRVRQVDAEAGRITFEDGEVVTADLIIGGDGIRSVVRSEIGITANITPAALACYRCNTHLDVIKAKGLKNFGEHGGIDYWGGYPGENGRSQYYKIVLSPCRDGEILSFYCFMPQNKSPSRKEGFRMEEVPVSEIVDPFVETGLDNDIIELLRNSVDRMPWRLYNHEPYPFWTKGKVCLLGDAAHPMLPNQSQGAVQALEDAAAIGIIMSPAYGYTNDIETGVKVYEAVRKPRATRVQWASYRATEDMNERIGFSSTPYSQKRHTHDGVLTIDEVNLYSMSADVKYKAEEMPPRTANGKAVNGNGHAADALAVHA